MDRRESFTKGGRWRILKDLKNEKTHEEGGVDIQFNTEEAPEEKVIAEDRRPSRLPVHSKNYSRTDTNLCHKSSNATISYSTIDIASSTIFLGKL